MYFFKLSAFDGAMNKANVKDNQQQSYRFKRDADIEKRSADNQHFFEPVLYFNNFLLIRQE